MADEKARALLDEWGFGDLIDTFKGINSLFLCLI